MPNLAELRVNEHWPESERNLRRQSWRGWLLVAIGLGLYLVVMAVARLALPAGSPALIPVEYILAHVLLYVPLPILFAFQCERRGWREVALWLLLAIMPAILAALARANLLPPPGLGETPAANLLRQGMVFLRRAVYPCGLGLWITVILGKRWQRSCPRGMAELGLAPRETKRQLLHLGIGLSVAIALLLHLRLTLLLAGLPLPTPPRPMVLLGLGGFTLAQESLGEELFYRGFFFQYLRRLNWSFWPAALLVASLDAVHFLSLPGALANPTMAISLVYYAFVYSAINCALIDRTKNLLTPWAVNTFFSIGVAVLGL